MYEMTFTLIKEQTNDAFKAMRPETTFIAF